LRSASAEARRQLVASAEKPYRFVRHQFSPRRRYLREIAQRNDSSDCDHVHRIKRRHGLLKLIASAGLALRLLGDIMGLRSVTRILALFVAMVLLVAGQTRAAADSAGFIADLGSRAVKVLSSSDSEKDREKQFRTLFDAGFDVPAITRFALGRYWQTASEAQRTEFTPLFTAYMVHLYTVRFNEFAGLQFKVTGSRQESENSSLVSSQMAKGSDAGVKVDWRVTAVSGGFKITDLVVEGISMAVTQRQEFSAVIQRNGGDIEALLKLLRAKAQQS
jgi:phospholipid transport system substrate-binding protein